jgi:hypothetical protein
MGGLERLEKERRKMGNGRRRDLHRVADLQLIFLSIRVNDGGK